jgi:hypothetical protein
MFMRPAAAMAVAKEAVAIQGMLSPAPGRDPQVRLVQVLDVGELAEAGVKLY